MRKKHHPLWQVLMIAVPMVAAFSMVLHITPMAETMPESSGAVSAVVTETEVKEVSESSRPENTAVVKAATASENTKTASGTSDVSKEETEEESSQLTEKQQMVLATVRKAEPSEEKGHRELSNNPFVVLAPAEEESEEIETAEVAEESTDTSADDLSSDTGDSTAQTAEASSAAESSASQQTASSSQSQQESSAAAPESSTSTATSDTSSSSSSASQGSSSSQTSGYTDLEYLAAISCAEAGNNYDGALAVANCVLNRLHHGGYGSSIYEVIYAPYQFWTDGADYYLRNGIGSEAMRAAQDALNGVNNLGSYRNFYAAYLGTGGKTDYVIIGGNLFY